jgi:hypothetical protein
MADPDAATPLLNGSADVHPRPRRPRLAPAVLLVLFLAALGIMLFYVEAVQTPGERGGHGSRGGWTDRLPADPREAAEVLLQRAPIIVRASLRACPWAARSMALVRT